MSTTQDTVAMPVYQDLLAQSVVQVSEIEGLKAGARTAHAEIERLRAECVVMDRAVLRMHEGRATAAAFEEAAKWHEQEAKLWSSPSAERHAESAKHFRAKAKAKGSEVRGK